MNQSQPENEGFLQGLEVLKGLQLPEDPQPEAEWVREFDALWRKLGLHLGYANMNDEKVKSFIESLLPKTRTAEQERCAKIVRDFRVHSWSGEAEVEEQFEEVAKMRIEELTD